MFTTFIFTIFNDNDEKVRETLTCQIDCLKRYIGEKKFLFP